MANATAPFFARLAVNVAKAGRSVSADLDGVALPHVNKIVPGNSEIT
jgi:hypothetical protein